VITKTMLIYSGAVSDGTPHMFALDKQTGKELARVAVPDDGAYGMMTYVHDGRQYLLLQGGPKLIAMALPSDKPTGSDDH